jgi:hypothetical protein
VKQRPQPSATATLSDDRLSPSRGQKFTSKGQYMSNSDTQRGGRQTVAAEESNGTPRQ